MDFDDLTKSQKLGLGVGGGAAVLILIGLTAGGGLSSMKEANQHREEVTALREQQLQQVDRESATILEANTARAAKAVELFNQYNPHFLVDGAGGAVPLKTGNYVKVTGMDGSLRFMGAGEAVASAVSGGDACIALMVDPYDPNAGVREDQIQTYFQRNPATGEVAEHIPPAVVGPTYCGAGPDVWEPKYQVWQANVQGSAGPGGTETGGLWREDAPNFQQSAPNIQSRTEQPAPPAGASSLNVEQQRDVYRGADPFDSTSDRTSQRPVLPQPDTAVDFELSPPSQSASQLSTTPNTASPINKPTGVDEFVQKQGEAIPESVRPSLANTGNSTVDGSL